MASLTSNTPSPNANSDANSDANSEINFDRSICISNTESLQEMDEKYSKTIIQNKSKQDACGYVIGDEIKIIWCSDSHGGNIDRKGFVIRDFLNSISDDKWIDYVNQEGFHLDTKDGETKQFKSNLFQDIVSRGPYFDTGATLSIVTITSTKIECYRVGDSPIFVFRDGENILYSDHDEEYKEDIEILKTRKYFEVACKNENGVLDEKDIMAKSPKILTQKDSNYILWDCGNKTNMTRSIGHNGIKIYEKRKKKSYEKMNNTGYCNTVEISLPSWGMTKTVIERIEGSKEKVVITTDGMSSLSGEFDYELMSSSASTANIMEVIYPRWKQDWICEINGMDKFIQRIPDWNRDDIALVMWNN